MRGRIYGSELEGNILKNIIRAYPFPIYSFPVGTRLPCPLCMMSFDVIGGHGVPCPYSGV